MSLVSTYHTDGNKEQRASGSHVHNIFFLQTVKYNNQNVYKIKKEYQGHMQVVHTLGITVVLVYEIKYS